MPFKKIFRVTSLGLLVGGVLVNHSAQAAVAQLPAPNAPNEQQMEQDIQKLETEVGTLSQEVNYLRKHQKRARVVKVYKRTYVYPTGSSLDESPNAVANAASIRRLQSERLTQGATVTTSPYLGLRSAFDASDLVVNISTMNEDLRLLQQREKIEQAYHDANLAPFASERPLVELSGAVEAQGVYQDPYQGPATTDIDLTKGELDTLGYISPWVMGLISMRYDNSPLPNTTDGAQVVGAGQRVANSRMFLRRGFITIGDLERIPFYFTIGQMFAPFGEYTSQMLTSPLTQSVGQVNDRIALLGFFEHGLYAEGYVFNAAPTTNEGVNRVDDGGVNVGYKHEGDRVSFEIGAGAIADISDAQGFQSTGAPLDTFQGFGYSSATEELSRRVPGANVHGELDLGKLSLVTEFVSATSSYAEENLSFNGKGAHPSAVHVEGDYSFTMFSNFPSVFTLAYGHSAQSLALNIPKDSYIAAITTSFWKDTIEELEYRHDQNYSSANYSSGNGFEIPVNSQGGGQNTVTLQAGVYF